LVGAGAAEAESRIAEVVLVISKVECVLLNGTLEIALAGPFAVGMGPRIEVELLQVEFVR